MLVTAARKRGWKTGAEISHTVLDKERARDEHVGAVQRDIYGNPLAQLICPNNPVARDYLIALFTDLVKNYDLDFVQTCLVPFAFAAPRLGGRGRSAHARHVQLPDLGVGAHRGRRRACWPPCSAAASATAAMPRPRRRASTWPRCAAR